MVLGCLEALALVIGRRVFSIVSSETFKYYRDLHSPMGQSYCLTTRQVLYKYRGVHYCKPPHT